MNVFPEKPGSFDVSAGAGAAPRGCQVSGPGFGSLSSVPNQDLAARQPLSDVASYSAASEQPSASTVAAAASSGAASAAGPREAVYLGAGAQDGEGEGRRSPASSPASIR